MPIIKPMKQFRTIILLTISLVLPTLSLSPREVLAQTDQNCINAQWGSAPLFNKKDIKPGDKFANSVTITKTSNGNSDIGISAVLNCGNCTSAEISQKMDFLSQFLLTIYDTTNNKQIYPAGGNTSSPFSNLFVDEGKEIYLASLSKGETVNYEFQIEFPSKITSYQGEEANFDINIGCIAQGQVRSLDTKVSAEWLGDKEGAVKGAFLEVLPQTGQTAASLAIAIIFFTLIIAAVRKSWKNLPPLNR